MCVVHPISFVIAPQSHSLPFLFFNTWNIFAPQTDFRFRDIRFTVEVSKTKAAVMGEKAGVKEILKGVSGVVASGQILAIVGASGAGKTSLLDVLVGKVSRISRICAGNIASSWMNF